MYDITVISIIVACIVSLVREYGGIRFILNRDQKQGIRGKEAANLESQCWHCLWIFVSNNTIAIVMAGPIAKEISEEYDIDPKRSASPSGYFYIRGAGMIPYGARASVCGNSHRTDSV